MQSEAVKGMHSSQAQKYSLDFYLPPYFTGFRGWVQFQICDGGIIQGVCGQESKESYLIGLC